MPSSKAFVWFCGTFCFHLACNSQAKNECASSPDAAVMGKGHLMVNQVLWAQQGVFGSWMSHSDEIKSTAEYQQIEKSHWSRWT